MTTPALVELPAEGIWRIGRAPDPFAWRHPDPVHTGEAGSGNRFDSFHGNFGVVYFATNPEACYAETLARFRPLTRLGDLVRTEWRNAGWMEPGSVAADWRDSRILIRARIVDALPFVDITHSDTLLAVREDIRVASWLESFGVGDVDLATVIGHDRRVTRLIAQWAAEHLDDDRPSYSGIRYMSRLGAQYECWAVFEGSSIEELERRPVLKSDADLTCVAERYRLTVH